jgi:arabinofuranan 3-O-arabinosyltransferase
MPSDSKLYLYLNPGRFLADAAGSFDPRQFAGWVPHQHIAYLWPAGPWFWLFDTIGAPDWVAHRLWVGTIMLAAGLGVRWCVRLLGLSASAALAAAVVYQTSLYVLPYVSRTSVMLLPWAGLGWVVAFTIRATRRQTWGDPAAIALIVLTVGAVNATALAMIVPAPVLWLAHSAWQRSASWRAVATVALRVGVLSVGVSLWWIMMLLIQGKYGTDVLPYSESVADVSLTSTSAEVWRGLGYWLFYLRDPFGATTTESLRYLTSTLAIFVSYLIPIVCLLGLVWTRWAHRRFAALLIATGVVLAVGVHPSDDRSPLMWLLTGGGDGGVTLALRSSTRAIPLLMLGLAISGAAMIDAVRPVRLPRLGIARALRADRVLAAVIVLLAIANLPALWTGAFVDPALERDQDPPGAWIEAAGELDVTGGDGRLLQLPGAEFGAYRWGYTVDQPLPGLTEKPLVTRDLLPLGSAGAMDLLYALDDRIQEGVLDPAALAPVLRLLGVDTVWLTNDHEFERFRTARPEVVRDLVVSSEGFGEPVGYGQPFLNRAEVPRTDERAVGDPRVGSPAVPVELVRLEQPGAVVRATPRSVLVSGSGDGVVDAATAGLVDGESTIRYSATVTDLGADMAEEIRASSAVIVTDSNRSRARHWRSSQDTTGFTEYGDPSLAPLETVSGDERLAVFETTSPDSRSVAEQRGQVSATASSYGEPFAYLPEHRPYMAIDGDLDTAWLVGEHGDPVGERFRLYLDADSEQVSVLQAGQAGARRITDVTVTTGDSSGLIPGTAVHVVLDERSLTPPGQPIDLAPSARVLELTIDAVGGGTPATASAISGVGFAEVTSTLGTATEIVRTPHDALSVVQPDIPLALTFNRLRSDPMNRWRNDPEPALWREFELPSDRRFELSPTVRIDAGASDSELAATLGWPAVASSRLTGSIRHAGVAALDDAPETAWITAFGEAQGATLAIADVTEPVAEVTIRQPVGGFSRVSAVTIRSGSESRVVELAPDSIGRSTATIEPPLPAGPLVIELTTVDPATTIDRRFGDTVELPAAISEIVIAGAPTVEQLGSATLQLDCVPLGWVGDAAISATLLVTEDALLDGAPLMATVCEAPLLLRAGTHIVRPHETSNPITFDGLVLDDGARDALSDTFEPVTATVVEDGRFERRIEIDGCSEGCWLVFGEGHNPAWSATSNGTSLGAPQMVDGGFNGWWLEPDTSVVTVRWTVQRRLTIALIASLLAALVAIALIVRDRQTIDTRPDMRAPAAAPAWSWFPPLWTRDRSLVAAAAWIVFSGLLIGPPWALWGAVAAAVALGNRRQRLGELTALACLIVVGSIVVLSEVRNSPFPNGEWPTMFNSVHGIGMFAVVSILVGALVADDADYDRAP